ncbi:PHP domain-like protein [Rhizoclosmatium globosum]|uniref:PHP domain-like protein n=1 Tax=Rhizoclosmatium globosum TaxID=329046 RepID=A0A1Y2CFK1_9FUNG|nr:PHP domain-like protein [Rhizoclosmatium globosum]|eukprot:ORY45584.1 PHP domain-like protein [Rhizoclosmatium globosum]
MFFDLNLPAGSLGASEYAAALEMQQRFGVTVVARNTEVKSLSNLRDSRATPGLAPEVSQSDAKQTTFRILERLTIVLDDSNTNLRIDAGNQKLQNYDVLAVKPLTEKALLSAVNADVDIIQLDLSTKLPFNLRKTTLNTAIQKGIYFELSYGPCIRDQNARRNIISNLQSILRVTAGKHLVVTSDAIRALDLRSPHDVMNLLQVFGLPDKYARDAITTSPRSVLYHAATRRDTLKGFVSVEPLDALTEGVKWKMGDVPTGKELEEGADFVSFGDLSGFE